MTCHRRFFYIVAAIISLGFSIPSNSFAYTGWPGGAKTRDLGREALIRHKAQDLDLATKLHEIILKQEPCNVWSLEKLGDIHKQKKNYDASIVFYTKAQGAIKCNKSKYIGLDDYARIAGKIKKANEAKKKKTPEEKKAEKPSRFKKGDMVFFEAESILFKNKYLIKGVVVMPGGTKSRVKILDNGGSIYINKEVYSIRNSLMDIPE